MKRHYLPLIAAAAVTGLAVTNAVTAMAAAHASPKVVAVDQDVSNGIVSAKEIVAGENGWMVVHRVKADGKPVTSLALADSPSTRITRGSPS